MSLVQVHKIIEMLINFIKFETEKCRYVHIYS